MKAYRYKCTLLTDAVITSEAATEGYRESLDYIPGSKFLGIVAGQLYDEEKIQQTLDIFHNSKVRFGDALPFYGSEEFLKVPLAWYYEKGGSLFDRIYLHHDLPKDSRLQLKQTRKGFFSPTAKKFLSIQQDFSLKSAHCGESRKSKDGQMFGYFSLTAGTEWIFTIEDSTGLYAHEIKNAIQGKHRIGRSRSAEYGLIEIKYIDSIDKTQLKQLDSQLIMYAKSNLAFIDEKTGQYTAQPSVKQLTGTEDAEIIWKKCQIRTRNYKTWNRKRGSKDNERLIIEAGSVFVVVLMKPTNSDFIIDGIGCHLNEGFGQVIIDPEFLTFREKYNLEKVEVNPQRYYSTTAGKNDEVLLQSLLKIRSRKDFQVGIDKKVNEFIAEYRSTFKGITKGQWGTLRNYGKHLKNYQQFTDLVFNRDVGFLYRGQSENDWRQKNRRGILQMYLERLPEGEQLPFVIKLSNQMAKN